MSKMDRKTALEILRAVKNAHWQTFSYKWVSGAIDVAIHELERLCQEPPKREYYGQ
jgi:hypothetical protein